jgi:hypothetical protein
VPSEVVSTDSAIASVFGMISTRSVDVLVVDDERVQQLDQVRPRVVGRRARGGADRTTPFVSDAGFTPDDTDFAGSIRSLSMRATIAFASALRT